MIKANDLQFEPFEDPKTPPMVCNYCEKADKGQGYLYADIKIAADATFTVVLCSRECEKKFKGSKGADEYLRHQMRKMRKIHRAQAIKKM